MARKQLSHKEKIEQIGNKLTNLALDMEKQAKEAGHITPTLANAMTNALRTSIEAFKYLDACSDLELALVEQDLSSKAKAKLDEIAKLLSEK